MRQGHREKLSVTVDPRLYDVIEQHASRTKLSKSKIIEEAIRVWERTRLAALAREGYQGMASEDLADAEAYFAVLDDLSEI
jgi:predicted transcriptional regulator